MICIDCKKECRKGAKRCIPCANINHAERAKLYKPKVQPDKICEVCQCKFMPYNSNQTFCSQMCKKRLKNDLSNQIWIKKEGELPKYSRKPISTLW